MTFSFPRATLKPVARSEDRPIVRGLLHGDHAVDGPSDHHAEEREGRQGTGASE